MRVLLLGLVAALVLAGCLQGGQLQAAGVEPPAAEAVGAVVVHAASRRPSAPR